jgi:hypothetical protein
VSSTPEDWLELVRSKARNVRFGVIQITIHDARVVQVECTEKTRLDARAASLPSARKAVSEAQG